MTWALLHLAGEAAVQAAAVTPGCRGHQQRGCRAGRTLVVCTAYFAVFGAPALLQLTSASSLQQLGVPPKYAGIIVLAVIIVLGQVLPVPAAALQLVEQLIRCWQHAGQGH